MSIVGTATAMSSGGVPAVSTAGVQIGVLFPEKQAPITSKNQQVWAAAAFLVIGKEVNFGTPALSAKIDYTVPEFPRW